MTSAGLLWQTCSFKLEDPIGNKLRIPRNGSEEASIYKKGHYSSTTFTGHWNHMTWIVYIKITFFKMTWLVAMMLQLQY
jgi:hypothetical protein